MSSVVQRQPLAEQTAAVLLERIKSGEWQLGQKLPGETTLATQLGVGRSTLREAIRELAGQGVLNPRQGAGVFVTSLDISEDWETILKRSSIVKVVEARIAIESEAATLAAEHRSPAELRAIRRLLAERADDCYDVEQHVDADMRFHRAVVASSQNEMLTELFDGFVPRIRRAMVEMLRIRNTPVSYLDQPDHEALVEAIAVKDGAAAAALSRSHLAAMKTALSS